MKNKILLELREGVLSICGTTCPIETITFDVSSNQFVAFTFKKKDTWAQNKILKELKKMEKERKEAEKENQNG